MWQRMRDAVMLVLKPYFSHDILQLLLQKCNLLHSAIPLAFRLFFDKERTAQPFLHFSAQKPLFFFASAKYFKILGRFFLHTTGRCIRVERHRRYCRHRHHRRL